MILQIKDFCYWYLNISWHFQTWFMGKVLWRTGETWNKREWIQCEYLVKYWLHIKIISVNIISMSTPLDSHANVWWLFYIREYTIHIVIGSLRNQYEKSSQIWDDLHVCSLKYRVFLFCIVSSTHMKKYITLSVLKKCAQDSLILCLKLSEKVDEKLM